MATDGPDTPALDVCLPSPLAALHDDRLTQHDLHLYLKRDDLIHLEVPGNRWRKLKYNLATAREQGHIRLLTFGGAFSNHIRAVAAAAVLPASRPSVSSAANSICRSTSRSPTP